MDIRTSQDRPLKTSSHPAVHIHGSLVIETMTLFSGLGNYLFDLQNAVEWRMVMSRGQDERFQMHTMSL